VRSSLEQQLEATQNILALHENRLESLMAERRRDTIQVYFALKLTGLYGGFRLST